MKNTILLTLSALALNAAAASAESLTETRAYYSTNPDGGVGKAATITIDGSLNGWSNDMLIATCGANDVATAFKGSHENNVLDMYALYAAWDDANLYLAWQMCNTGDVWAREGDGPLTDYGHIGDVPMIVALSVDPSTPGMTGLLEDGRCIWCDNAGHGTTFDPAAVHVDHLFFMSGKPGQGSPAMFTASNASGATNYGSACHLFAQNGISYNIAHDFLPEHLWRQRSTADWATPTELISDPSVLDDIYDAEKYDNLKAGAVEGLKPHSHEFDTFFEMVIPLKALGITRQWLEANGVGVRVIGTRGESALDCIPFDPSMVDNTFGEYAKDPSTTHEKDDLDVITYAMADIARVRDLSNIQPVPDPEPTPTPDPQPTPDPVGDGNYTAYFDNTGTSWPNVMVWAWDAADGDKNYTGGTWPGQSISLDPASGYYKFSCTVTNDAPKMMIIFNNGSGTQTADLEFHHNGIYTASGFSGNYVSSVSEVSVDRLSVYTSGHSLVIDTPTAANIQVARPDGVCFILEAQAGRNVYDLPRGLYIVNGKKVIL